MDTAFATQQHKASNGRDARPPTAPPVDIYEDGDEVLIMADVPGVSAQSVVVRLEKDELFLHARTDGDNPGEALAGGQKASAYTRTFVVPSGIDADRISAELKNGVLTIRLPKSEAVKPRKIEVKAS